jgi:hypothetical protein
MLGGTHFFFFFFFFLFFFAVKDVMEGLSLFATAILRQEHFKK